jgi:uncharacterized protein YjiS (DUF1127 family)
VQRKTTWPVSGREASQALIKSAQNLKENTMTSTTISRSGTSHVLAPRAVLEALGRLAGGMADYWHRIRTERELECLDDRLLADIGLMRSDIRPLVWGEECR